MSYSNEFESVNATMALTATITGDAGIPGHGWIGDWPHPPFGRYEKAETRGTVVRSLRAKRTRDKLPLRLQVIANNHATGSQILQIHIPNRQKPHPKGEAICLRRREEPSVLRTSSNLKIRA